ncbi:hypothetical protein HA052_17365 [Chromobacterium haemolyticum]|uniref:Tetratricopeptide repeat protein n=1 Tax=Chromobacterium fluminis TaxID=3044269 RepID=A0ABX0LEY1_9NEIS|nr:hypothetical protein [Chromobacterium haemolyticum]NHR06960.1 hypothetical protein [Chromobacterium haemolyticum]
MSRNQSKLDEAVAKGKLILSVVEDLLREVQKEKEDAALLASGKIREIAQTYRLARECYCSAIQVNGKNIEARVRFVITYLKDADVRKGLPLAIQLAEKYPSFIFNDITGHPVSVQTVLGDAYRVAGDMVQARQAYEAALKLQSTDTHSAVYLAQILASDGLLEEAADIASRSLDGTASEPFKATLRLLANDPNRLPAIAGIIEAQAGIVSFHV